MFETYPLVGSRMNLADLETMHAVSTGANTHTALGRFGTLEPLEPFESLSGFDFHGE